MVLFIVVVVTLCDLMFILDFFFMYYFVVVDDAVGKQQEKYDICCRNPNDFRHVCLSFVEGKNGRVIFYLI